MNSLLFLCLGAGLSVLAAVKNSAGLHSAINKHSAKIRVLPKAIGLLIITAQVSELVKVVEHVSLANMVAALFLLAIVLAAKSGTESELL